jgi:hypothetical protein
VHLLLPSTTTRVSVLLFSFLFSIGSGRSVLAKRVQCESREPEKAFHPRNRRHKKTQRKSIEVQSRLVQGTSSNLRLVPSISLATAVAQLLHAMQDGTPQNDNERKGVAKTNEKNWSKQKQKSSGPMLTFKISGGSGAVGFG